MAKAIQRFMKQLLRPEAPESAGWTIKDIFTKSLMTEPEKPIFQFQTADSLKPWISSSDKIIGGKSTCELVHDETGKAVFRGNLSLELEHIPEDVERSGFCAIRAKVPREGTLAGYEALTMRIKTDGRQYRVNAQTQSWNPNDLFVGVLVTPSNEWVEVELAFRDFLLTSGGRVPERQEKKLTGSDLISLGFTIADDKTGPFEMQIEWIKAKAEATPRNRHVNENIAPAKAPRPGVPRKDGDFAF